MTSFCFLSTGLSFFSHQIQRTMDLVTFLIQVARTSRDQDTREEVTAKSIQNLYVNPADIKCQDIPLTTLTLILTTTGDEVVPPADFDVFNKLLKDDKSVLNKDTQNLFVPRLVEILCPNYVKKEEEKKRV